MRRCVLKQQQLFVLLHHQSYHEGEQRQQRCYTAAGCASCTAASSIVCQEREPFKRMGCWMHAGISSNSGQGCVPERACLCYRNEVAAHTNSGHVAAS
jgi:hypothetical protein